MEQPQKEEVEAWKRNPWGKLPTWAKWTLGVVGAVVLLAIGAAIGSGEADDLKAERDAATRAAAKAEQERDDAEAAADAVLRRRDAIVRKAKIRATGITGRARSESSRLNDELSGLRNEVDAAEGELEATESSLAGAEREEALSSFGDGIWQAEVDFIPGTYRTEGGEGCYYAQLGSANTNDISSNEITLERSQQIVTIESPYFQSKDCGTWERIE